MGSSALFCLGVPLCRLWHSPGTPYTSAWVLEMQFWGFGLGQDNLVWVAEGPWQQPVPRSLQAPCLGAAPVQAAALSLGLLPGPQRLSAPGRSLSPSRSLSPPWQLSSCRGSEGWSWAHPALAGGRSGVFSCPACMPLPARLPPLPLPPAPCPSTVVSPPSLALAAPQKWLCRA